MAVPRVRVRLNDTNWQEWSTDIQLQLLYLGLSDVIADGDGTPDPAADSRVRGLIGISVDPHLQGLVMDSATPREAWAALEDLTMWQEVNQREVAQLGGPSLLIQLVQGRLGYLAPTGPAPAEQDVDMQTVLKALSVLLNVTANDDLALRVSQIPGCFALLVKLMGHQHAALHVLAARCIINVTHSTAATADAADKAAGPALEWVMSNHVADAQGQARLKLGCWILSNLAAPDAAPVRARLLASSQVLRRLVQLLASGTPDAIVVLAANLIASLAREGRAAQFQLLQAGSATALILVLQPAPGAADLDGQIKMPAGKSQAMTAALLALSSLSLEHAGAVCQILSVPSLPPCLTLLLEHRASPYDCTHEDAGVVLAAHTLVHVLGHMLVNSLSMGAAVTPSTRPNPPSPPPTGLSSSPTHTRWPMEGGDSPGRASPRGPSSPGRGLSLRGAGGGSSRSSSPAQLSPRAAPSASSGGSVSTTLGMAGARYSRVTGTVVHGPDMDLVDGSASLRLSPQLHGSRSQSPVPTPMHLAQPRAGLPGSPWGADGERHTKGGAGRGPAGEAEPGDAVYISLSAAARAVGVVLPAVPQLTARKDGGSVLEPLQAAELRHRVTRVLLPRLRSPNHRMAASGAAALYHLCAACGGPAAKEARQLMADSAIVGALLARATEGNPELSQACLAVLDVLSAEPRCVGVMMASPWFAVVSPLLESPDALVKRWAERALCSLYMATGGPAADARA